MATARYVLINYVVEGYIAEDAEDTGPADIRDLYNGGSGGKRRFWKITHMRDQMRSRYRQY